MVRSQSQSQSQSSLIIGFIAVGCRVPQSSSAQKQFPQSLHPNYTPFITFLMFVIVHRMANDCITGCNYICTLSRIACVNEQCKPRLMFIIGISNYCTTTGDHHA